MTDPDSSGLNGATLDWREVKILYWRELRAALREKAIVINSILIPIFLCPLMLWAAFTGIMFVQGQTEGFVSRTVVREWPKGHPALRGKFERNKLIQLALKGVPGDAEKQIKDGTLDALVEFLPAEGTNATLAGNFRMRVTFNESKERSATA